MANNYIVTINGKQESFKDAVQAFEASQKELARLQTESDAAALRAKQPLQITVNDKGKVSAYFGDKDLGKFPAFSLHGAQLECLIANMDVVKTAYEEMKAAGKVVARWQDVPKARATK